MGTRSTISVKMIDGKIGIITCQYDGYISVVGNLLSKCYQNQSQAEALIQLGNLSSLDETLSTTLAYGRDYNETGQKALFFNSDKEAQRHFKDGCYDYHYFWNGQEWYVDGEELKNKL